MLPFSRNVRIISVESENEFIGHGRSFHQWNNHPLITLFSDINIMLNTWFSSQKRMRVKSMSWSFLELNDLFGPSHDFLRTPFRALYSKNYGKKNQKVEILRNL